MNGCYAILPAAMRKATATLDADQVNEVRSCVAYTRASPLVRQEQRKDKDKVKGTAATG